MPQDSFIEKYIGRIVAFVLTPMLLPLVGAAAVWAQDALGVDLNAGQVTGFVVDRKSVV